MPHEPTDPIASLTPRSYWLASTSFATFPSLDHDLDVDVVVVGAGITGVTAAWLLCNEGLRVALLEADEVARGTTGHTTAKITAQHGLIYRELIEHTGLDNARLYYQAAADASRLVAETIGQRAIDCDFSVQDAFVYATSDGGARQVEQEYEAYGRLGIDGALLAGVPFPALRARSAVCMRHQAQFHPLRYLSTLVGDIVERGGMVFERTVAVAVTDGDRPTVHTREGRRVSGDFVLACTHFPFHDAAGLYFARMQAERSYVIAVDVEEYPGGMYLSAEQPTRSIRSAPAGDRVMALVGGEGHKAGEGEDTGLHYEALTRFAAQVLKAGQTAYRWSAQDLTTLDKMAYIGELTRDRRNILVATGYRKWGMTTGTTAARLLCDIVVERENPYRELFAPSRFYADPTVKHFLMQNTAVALHLIRGKLERPAGDIGDLANGEGAVVTFAGQRAGAWRGEDGRIQVVDSTCTHLGCEVVWNHGDRTWDCPCHGSRFSVDGDVLEGPAKRALRRLL